MKNLLYLLVSVSLVLAGEPQVNTFATGSNLFTADVYNQILLDNKDNILVSPFSAETIFALTQSGAVGSTGDEIRSTLHLPSTKTETESTIKSVLPTLQTTSISLTSANKIYVENLYPIKANFKAIATEVYEAEFQNIEFKNSANAAEEINNWIENETGGRIHDMVTPDSLDDTTRLVLINALYFKGNWSQPFASYNPTQINKFYTSLETEIDITYMYQSSGRFNYYDSIELNAQILELPFQGDEATMTIVLPNKKEGIAVLEKQINKALAAPDYSEEIVEVLLPKFKIESSIDFKDILEKLGVKKAFEVTQADFSGIAGEKGDLFISQVQQKTYIDVNEYGVEATAATITIGHNNPAPIPLPSKSFIADHPFIFYIKIHDIVLFEGRVLEPKY